MSQENVEAQRRVVDAFNARDIEAFVTYCDPNIELHSAFAAVGGAVYQGLAGVRSWHRDFEDVWGGEVRVEVEAYFDLGERVLAYYVLHGRGLKSGVPIDMSNALVTRWHGGVMNLFRVYAHREDALSDLGLSEESLEPIDP